MARYTGPVCRLCRRIGIKLYLKGERCYTPKCPVERRPYPPGEHSQRRRRVSDRGLQLREKQKARNIYGILERQFHRYYEEAVRRRGVTGEHLVRLLEMRLDNVVHRLGFGDSRAQARQIVRHSHITINGRKTNIPSYQVKVGDVIGWTESGRRSEYYKMLQDKIEAQSTPSWLSLDKGTLTGRVVSEPTVSDIELLFDPSAIVEYYSR